MRSVRHILTSVPAEIREHRGLYNWLRKTRDEQVQAGRRDDVYGDEEIVSTDAEGRGGNLIEDPEDERREQ